MPRWSWAGATVFVLSLCLGIGWATALIMSASSRTPPTTDNTKDILSGVGGGLVGVIGAYIGASIQKRRDGRDEPPDDDEQGPAPA